VRAWAIGEGIVPTVAYLTPLYFDDKSCVGGGERYPQNLALGVALASRGRYKIEILSHGPEALRKELHPNVTLRVMPTDPPRHVLDAVSWECLDAIGSADLLHVHQAYTRSSEAGYLTAKLHRIPICVTDHGGAGSKVGMGLNVVDLVDRFVCQSDFAARSLKTTAETVLIKGGVDGDLFRPPVERPTRDRVLFVGRFLPHKGIDRLIKALPSGLPLTCCGRPYDADYFRALQKLAEGKSVEFVTDATDERIRDYYSRAWANVLPSVYRDYYGVTHMQPELMGFTLLEGMACGTPVICSRVGGMPEFVRHGETGYVYDELEELTQHLKAVSSDSVLVERMGRAARRAVDQEYDLKVCGSKLVAVYDELLAESAAVGRAAA